MDDRTRIAKLEAEMETMRESNTRLHQSMDLLHGDLEKLRSHIDKGFEKQKDRIDRQGELFVQKLSDERVWADGNFKDIRASIEQGFAESRAEAKAAKRWLIGLVVTILIGISDALAKAVFGA